jgi:hypothetical protein
MCLDEKRDKVKQERENAPENEKRKEGKKEQQ